jgi:hypothetical protein
LYHLKIDEIYTQFLSSLNCIKNLQKSYKSLKSKMATNNTKLYMLNTSYFTDDVYDTILATKEITDSVYDTMRTIKDVIFNSAWEDYCVFHNRFEPINSTNGFFIIGEFRYVFDKIISNEIPKQDFCLYLETI